MARPAQFEGRGGAGEPFEEQLHARHALGGEFDVSPPAIGRSRACVRPGRPGSGLRCVAARSSIGLLDDRARLVTERCWPARRARISSASISQAGSGITASPKILERASCSFCSSLSVRRLVSSGRAGCGRHRALRAGPRPARSCGACPAASALAVSAICMQLAGARRVGRGAADLAHAFGARQRVLDRFTQRFRLDRLEQVIAGLEPHGRHGGFERGLPRHQQQLQPRPVGEVPAHRAEELDAVRRRHVDVADDHVDLGCLAQDLQRFGRGLGRAARDRAAAQNPRHQAQGADFVIDDQDSARAFRAFHGRKSTLRWADRAKNSSSRTAGHRRRPAAKMRRFRPSCSKFTFIPRLPGLRDCARTQRQAYQ